MGFGDYNLDLPDGENFAPSEEHVKTMQGLLGPEPFHLGEPASNRSAWERWQDHPIGQHWIKEAANAQSGPRITNELIAASYQSDSRAVYTKANKATRDRLIALTLAECIQPTGQHLPAIEAEIMGFENLITWINPAHDDSGKNFTQETIEIDLGSAQWAMLFADIDYLLGDRLLPATRQMIRTEIERRIFAPFRQRIESGKDIYWWVTCNHNWNTVCLNCVLGCALYLQEDIKDRAWYLALADDLIKYSNSGFEESGFYTEGMSYWVYGFGNYVAISELVRAATGGKIDWLKEPLQNRMAHYGVRMELQNGLYPTFADSQLVYEPVSWITHWLNNRRDDDPARIRATEEEINAFDHLDKQSMTSLLLNLFHTEEGPAYKMGYGFPVREWFDDVQFLICRPRKDAGSKLRKTEGTGSHLRQGDGGHAARSVESLDVDSPNRTTQRSSRHQAKQIDQRGKFAATFKGGHNGVNHNHNDLGTFTVAIDNKYLIVDPGLEIYTARTFSPKRYHSDLLNSYGHPVPVVADQLQVPAKDEHRAGYGSHAYATVLETAFSDDQDRVVLDLTKAYEVESLTSLHRAFVYERTHEGRVEVTDTVAFTQPENFETALITYADWTLNEDGSLMIKDGDKGIHVTVTTEAGPLEFNHTIIQESATPTRLAWRLAQPVKNAVIKVVVRPV